MNEYKKWIDFKGNLDAQEPKALIALKSNITNRTMCTRIKQDF